MATRSGRRGRNEGSITRRADGRWVARQHLGYDSRGKRVRKHYYGSTRAEVQEKLARGLAEASRGIVVRRDERETLGAFLASWLAETVRGALRPSTYRTYEYIVRVHLVPGLGRISLAKLEPRQVQAFLNEKAASSIAPRTVGHIRAVLRAALNDAVRWGLTVRNPAAVVDPPRIPRAEVSALSPQQAETIIAAVSDDRLGALYVLALSSGMRQGEVLGLQWANVDLAEGRIAVRQALQRVGGVLTLCEPKTERSRRTIDLPALAIEWLSRHRRAQIEERLIAGSDWEDRDLVFTTATGRPLDGVAVTHRFHRLLGAHGLPPMRFHDLRHGCASLLLAQGVSPRVVMDILGHSQISLTLNTYSHVIPALRVDAADKLDAALRGLATG